MTAPTQEIHSPEKHTVDVCIVGGGPAGMVLALLLSHVGIKTLVLEKHNDFSREFRGEVLMPRFQQMMRQLNLEDWLLTIPHLKLRELEAYFEEKLVAKIQFDRIAPETKYALWMPQTKLLEALHEKAKGFPAFDLWFGASAKSLVKSGEAVTGVVVDRDGREVTVNAKVTVGADGRYSTVLKEGGFELAYDEYKFDVLWFTVPKPKDYDDSVRALVSRHRTFILLPRFPDQIQIGILVSPGELSEMRKEGIGKLRAELAQTSPLFRDFAEHLKDFTPFHPLQARLHMVKEWAKDGCLLIGDAAHCCSPAGAIGVSAAVGSAIVAADVIAWALPTSPGPLAKDILSEVQRQREPDVRTIHRIQRALTGRGLSRFFPAPRLLPFFLLLGIKTGLFRFLQRKLVVQTTPLKISPELSFSS